MMWCKAVFEYSKITSANLCKLIHDIINYSTESGKCGKEGKKSQKSEYLGNEKRYYHWKNKKLIKNSGHKL